MAHFTKTFHRKTYPAISSSSPTNSALGRTVLVTGATSRIGSAISHAFMNAGASKIILTGRKEATLATTIEKLEEIRPPRCETKLLTHENDLADQASTQALWKTLAEDGIAVDILILNAAARWSGPLRNSSKEVWSLFETDVLGNLRMSESFLNQGPDNGKIMIYVSSGAVHFHPAPDRAYASDKMAATNLFLHLAEEFQPEQVQIIAFHPGSVLTAVGKAMGLDENSLPWDNENLPADFSVWLSTKAASFLHGRFVWANWDVDELVSMKPKIQSEPGFLKMGLQGVEMVGPDLFAQIAELEKREKSMKE